MGDVEKEATIFTFCGSRINFWDTLMVDVETVTPAVRGRQRFWQWNYGYHELHEVRLQKVRKVRTSLTFEFEQFATLELRWGPNSNTSKMLRFLKLRVRIFRIFWQIVREIRKFRIYLTFKFKKIIMSSSFEVQVRKVQNFSILSSNFFNFTDWDKILVSNKGFHEFI